jgi:hypothetical protein
MAEGYPHGLISQLPTLPRRQLVHPGAVLLHNQGACRFLFHDFPHAFHPLFIPPARPNVNVAGQLSRLLKSPRSISWGLPSVKTVKSVVKKSPQKPATRRSENRKTRGYAEKGWAEILPRSTSSYSVVCGKEVEIN